MHERKSKLMRRFNGKVLPCLLFALYNDDVLTVSPSITCIHIEPDLRGGHSCHCLTLHSWCLSLKLARSFGIVRQHFSSRLCRDGWRCQDKDCENTQPPIWVLRWIVVTEWQTIITALRTAGEENRQRAKLFPASVIKQHEQHKGVWYMLMMLKRLLHLTPHKNVLPHGFWL